ncbi:MAG: hypothetical protein R2711_13740 [Acidimicrobiales bacterium]
MPSSAPPSATCSPPARDGTTTTAPATTDEGQAPPADGERPDGPMGRGPGGGFDRDAAAEALGITTDELQTQLEAGQTLAEIAEAQGVDKQDLIDALVKAGEAKLDEAKAELPDRIAELVDSTLPARGEGGPGRGGPGGRGPGLDAAAEALGVTADELRTELQDGKTLADVAEAKGVDQQTVIDAMVADLKAHLDEEVASGEHTQEEADQRLADATERITTMVTEGMPAGGPGGHGPGAPDDGGN